MKTIDKHPNREMLIIKFYSCVDTSEINFVNNYSNNWFAVKHCVRETANINLNTNIFLKEN